MSDKMTAAEVCKELDISWVTLNNWYRYKRENSDDELAKILPDYEKEHEKSQRLWKKSDIEKLKEFKEKRNLGRNGQMSKTIQKYYKKEK